MSASDSSVAEAIGKATEYPTGISFDAAFEAFSVRITTLPDSELRFRIAEGPYARTETVKITSSVIRPGLFLVSWVEAGGATVVHLEDFTTSVIYSHATLPDGTFLRMQASIHVVESEKSP